MANISRTSIKIAIASLALVSSIPALAYDYVGSPVTNMSGSLCLPVTTNSNEGLNNNEVTRAIDSGLTVQGNWTGGAMSFTCPLLRRNGSDYGKNTTTRYDRLLMTSLRIRVSDGKSTDWVSCIAYVKTATGSTYNSSWRYACTSTGGCTTQPPASFTGTTELLWSNPFGSTAIENVGASNVGYMCLVPGNSHIVWAEAAYSPNN